MKQGLVLYDLETLANALVKIASNNFLLVYLNTCSSTARIILMP